MASQRQDFLRKLGKGWSPIHMNLNRPKTAFHKPKKEAATAALKSDGQDLIDAEFADSSKSK